MTLRSLSAAAALLTVAAAAADMPVLRGNPYLQNPTPNGMTVMYQTHGPARSWVEYGTDTVNTLTARQLAGGQEVCHDIEHKVRLSGLTPGQRYWYRVGAREITSNKSYSKSFGDTELGSWHSFTVPVDTAAPFTVLVFNDLHDSRQTIEGMSQLARTIPHDMVVFNGDCISEPSSRDHAIEMIHRLNEAYGAADTPILYIRGNHEIRNAYSSGMLSLLDMPGGNTYGAFTLWGTRWLVLDCGEDKPDDTWVYYGLNDFSAFRQQQAEWLQRELRSADYRDAAHRVLISHIPVWGNTDNYRPCTELWSPVLTQAAPDLACGAHTHEHRHHAPGTVDANPCPVLIGGGYQPDQATLTVLRSDGTNLTATVLSIDGTVLTTLSL